MSDAHGVIETAYGAVTSPGVRRTANEDAYLAAAPVFVVADGMGGHDAGAAASAAVVAEFADFVGRSTVSGDDLRAAVSRARVAVDRMARGDRACGSTLAGVVVTDVGGAGYWLVLNLGDSRGYRYADGILEQLTTDHSVVQELVDAGVLTRDQAQRDNRRNEITRAIGAGSEGDVDLAWIPAEVGDRILICSDGLTTEVDDERIARILGAEQDPESAATRLVHEALVRGGRDNVTVLVVDALAVVGHDTIFDTAPAGVARREIDEDTLPRGGRTR